MHRVFEAIDQRIDQPLDLASLASVAHFSPYHFHRLFRALVGETVTEYVRRLRLESAAVALKNTDKTVLQIALDAGEVRHEPVVVLGLGPVGLLSAVLLQRSGADVAAVDPLRWRRDVATGVAAAAGMPTRSCRS